MSVDWRAEDLSPERVVALWRGDLHLPAAEAAITATAALALRALGRADDQQAAQSLAERLWSERGETASGAKPAALAAT